MGLLRAKELVSGEQIFLATRYSQRQLQARGNIFDSQVGRIETISSAHQVKFSHLTSRPRRRCGSDHEHLSTIRIALMVVGRWIIAIELGSQPVNLPVLARVDRFDVQLDVQLELGLEEPKLQ